MAARASTVDFDKKGGVPTPVWRLARGPSADTEFSEWRSMDLHATHGQRSVQQTVLLLELDPVDLQIAQYVRDRLDL